MSASNWIQQADQAMVRAAARARVMAASTNTAIHIMKDGKIVEIFPAKEVRYPVSSRFQEESELSVVREDPASPVGYAGINVPPYGSEKPQDL